MTNIATARRAAVDNYPAINFDQPMVSVEDAEAEIGDIMTDEICSIVDLYESDESDDMRSYVAALMILDSRDVDFEDF